MGITEIPQSDDWITVRETFLSTPHRGKKLELIGPNDQVYSLYDGREDDFRLCDFVFGSKLFVVNSHNENFNSERIEIWKLENPPISLIERTFEDRNLRISKVDERFIVAEEDEEPKTLYFISTETLEVFTSLSVKKSKYEYNRGLLFQSRGNGIVHVLDVATGTRFSDVHLPLRDKDNDFIKFISSEEFKEENERTAGLLDTWASSNSNFVVIGWNCWNNKKREILFYLSVYDLDAIKKRNSDPGSHLLYTLDVLLDIRSFLVNESQIVCYGRNFENGEEFFEINFVTTGLVPTSSASQENHDEDDEDAFLIKIDRSLHI
jgi:hypothetical protein